MDELTNFLTKAEQPEKTIAIVCYSHDMRMIYTRVLSALDVMFASRRSDHYIVTLGNSSTIYITCNLQKLYGTELDEILFFNRQPADPQTVQKMVRNK